MIHAKNISKYIEILTDYDLRKEYLELLSKINNDFSNKQIFQNIYDITYNKVLINKIQFELINNGFLSKIEKYGEIYKLYVSVFKPYTFEILY